MPVKAVSVSRRFNEKWALRNVSFEAREGRVTGIYGPAGSGKSVLLRILAGLDGKFSGEVQGVSPETSSVAISSLHVGVRSARRFAFWPFRTSTPDISSAEGQLFELQRARTADATVVIIDDGFCRLDDARKRAEFDSLRSSARDHHKTIIFVTANFQDAVEFCDEIAIIDRGEILQSGAPEKVYLEPDSAAVARLTGRNNLFEARRLTSTKADIPEFQTIAGSFRLRAIRVSGDRLGALNQNVLLAVRPEHISISFGASFPEDNLIKARITGVRFLGANTLVELDAAGLRLEALVMRLVGLAPGDECMLGMPPDRIRIYA